MKKILLIISILWSTAIIAQQKTTFSQYMLNPYILNPAAAGINDETSLFLHYRNQWMGFSNSPQSFAVTLETPLMDNKSGVGVQFVSDQSHILSSLSGRLSYRYTVAIKTDHKLGFGLYGEFMQRKIRYSEIENGDTDDPALFKNDLSKSTFDAGFGIYYTWKSLEAGFAIDQLLNNKFTFQDDISENSTSFQNIRHFTLNVAYEYGFKGTDWSVKPSLILRSFQGANVSNEFTAIAKWNKMLWAGAGYRQNFGVIFLAGVKVMDQISFGYSYDYSLGAMQNQNKGSHEVLVAYTFGKRGSGNNAETKRILRKQANDIRELKVQNEQLKEKIESLNDDEKRLLEIEKRDSIAMQQIIDDNKVERIPENKSLATDSVKGTENSNSAQNGNSNEVIDALEKRVRELEQQVEDYHKNDSANSDEALNNKVQQLEAEIGLLKSSISENSKEETNENGGSFHVVTGSYFNSEDAKSLQKILKRELDLDTRIVSRSDRKFFFVITKQLIEDQAAQDEMKRLKEIGIHKYINGNLWIYQAPPTKPQQD